MLSQQDVGISAIGADLQGLLSQPFDGRRNECTIRNLVACLKLSVAPPDNPNASA